MPILANITEFGQTPLYTREELGSVGVDVVLVLLLRVPRHERGRARDLRGHPPRRNAEERPRSNADAARICTSISTITRTRRSWTNCSARGKRNERNASGAAAGGTQAEEIGGLVRRSRGQHRALHRGHEAATICTTAATTFSTSPRTANSRRSPICWCTRSCRIAPSSPPTRPSSRACACLPKAVLTVARAAARRRAIRWTCCAPACRRSAASEPEAEGHPVEGARDIADRLLASPRLDALLLASLRARRPAHRARDRRRFHRRAFPASAARAKRPRREWVRAMHTSLNLYAEHEFNASTFTARVIAGTGSDIYSCDARARSARCADRSTAARTRWRSRFSSATPRPTRRRATSGGGSRPRRSSSASATPCTRSPIRAIRSSRRSRARLARGGQATSKGYRDRRAHRVGHEEREEHVPESRLVLGGVLSPDGRAHRDVHAVVRDQPHLRLGGAHHRAAHRRQDHPAERQLHGSGESRSSCPLDRRP